MMANIVELLSSVLMTYSYKLKERIMMISFKHKETHIL